MSSPTLSGDYIIQHPADLGMLDNSNTKEPEEDISDEWIRFFHSNNTLLKTKSMQEWSDGKTSEVATLTGLGITNNILPKSTFGVGSVNRLLMESNGLSNIDFLGGVKTIKELRLSNNPALNNISGMRDVVSIGELYLNNTGITDIDALANLKYANNIDLSGNENLIYLYALKKLTNGDSGKLRVTVDYRDIHHPGKYLNTGLSAESSFCQLFNKGGVDLRFRHKDYTYSNPKIGELCVAQNIWLSFLHKTGQYLEIIYLEDFMKPPYNRIDISGKGFKNEDLPRYFGMVAFNYINVSRNPISHIRFLAGLKHIEYLDVSNTDISNLGGLDQATYIGQLDARYLRFIPNLYSLRNLTRTGGLNFKYSNSLHDISDLSNLTSTISLSGVKGKIILPHLYVDFPSASSPFCQGWKKGDISVYVRSPVSPYDDIEVDYGSYCTL